MQIELLTRKDFEDFRKEILQALAALSKEKLPQQKEWLRTREVRQLLGNISSNTLQSLRVKGLLHPSKIEGVYYYKFSEIQALLNGNTE